jgi:hypothetical protein
MIETQNQKIEQAKWTIDPTEFYKLGIYFGNDEISSVGIENLLLSSSEDELKTAFATEPTKFAEALEKAIASKISVKIQENICGKLDDEMKIAFQKSCKEFIEEIKEEISAGEMNN